MKIENLKNALEIEKELAIALRAERLLLLSDETISKINYVEIFFLDKDKDQYESISIRGEDVDVSSIRNTAIIRLQKKIRTLRLKYEALDAEK